MTHVCSSQGWMVQDLINYSSIGATARCKQGPQGSTGDFSMANFVSPHAPFWPKNHQKNQAETKGLEGRPEDRKRVARTPIRSCLCSPNTFSHFPQKLKISLKMCPFWVPISLILGTFFEAFSNKWPKGSRAPPQSGKKIRKWIPRVPKCSPNVTQINTRQPKRRASRHQIVHSSVPEVGGRGGSL